MTSPATVTVSYSQELELVECVLSGLGASREETAAQSKLLLEADLRGRPSHGLQRLPTIAARVRNGLLRPGAPVTAQWRTDVFLDVDGGHGFGPYVAFETLGQLEERARAFGLAMGGIRCASHLGMLAPYLELATDRGLIAVVLTTSEALVHPAGGAVALLGTNPIGVGIPAGAQEPFILDMSTGAISMGEVIVHAQAGNALPLGVAVDGDGQPTTDASRAREGALAPFGGHKGYGLGLAFELLVSVLTGTALGNEILGTLDHDHPVTKGDLFLMLDPRVVGCSTAEIGAYLDILRSSTPAVRSQPVRVPGDRSRSERARRMQDGIELSEALWQQVLALAPLPAARSDA